MPRYEAISIYSMSLRPDHNVNNTPIRSITAQSRMQGDTLWEATGEKWLRVTHVNSTAIAQPGWVAIVSASRVYCALTDTQPPTEPPAVTFPPEITLKINGQEKVYVPKL